MGTTAQKLDRLLETKNGLREIINAKGVSVSEDDTFNSYIDKVAAIPSDMAEATITANGTYRASDQGIDGFSSVIVNVDTGGSGGGGGASLGTKTITENGTYNATADGLDGYYSVEVEVPNTGTLIDKTITEVGTFNPVDDGADGYSSGTVKIDPETMAAPGDKFTVNFYIGDTLSLRVPDVPYGGMAEYPNASLINDNYNHGYFYGWDPVPNNVRRNMNCYARFSQAARPIGVNEIYEPWEDIIAADKGLNIPLGAYRYLHLGTVGDVNYGSIRMQKVYEGESGSTSTWLAMDVLTVRKLFNDEDVGKECYWGGKSSLRDWLNNDVFNTVFPQILKDNIVAVSKYSDCYPAIGDHNHISLDKLWIPSHREIVDPSGSHYNDYETQGPNYYNSEYFSNAVGNNSISSGAAPNYFTRTNSGYWYNKAHFAAVREYTGQIYAYGNGVSYNTESGIRIGFCL